MNSLFVALSCCLFLVLPHLLHFRSFFFGGGWGVGGPFPPRRRSERPWTRRLVDTSGPQGPQAEGGFKIQAFRCYPANQGPIFEVSGSR